MQLFSKKNAKIFLAVLVAICLAGCASKAPVAEIVEVPVETVAVVEAPAPAPEPAPAPAPAPAPEPAPAPAPAPAPEPKAVDVTPIVNAIEAFANAVVKSAVGPIVVPEATAGNRIEAPSGVATYSAEYEVVGYKYVFKALDNAVGVSYIDTFSEVENYLHLADYAAKLPNVVEAGIASPGKMVFKMSAPIEKSAFDSFVKYVSKGVYDSIYTTVPADRKSVMAAPAGVATYTAEYSVAGYKLVFKAIGNSLVFNYIDTMSDDEAENTLRNISALVPNVVSCGIAGPGSMVFKMNQPISKAAFDAFVDTISSKAYDVIYPVKGSYSADFSMYGYNFVFAAEGNSVEFKFIDTLSAAQKADALEALSALLPGVVSASSPRSGVMSFELKDAINGYYFDKFVSDVCDKIVTSLYPVNSNAEYSVAGYKLVFKAIENYVVFNYIDSLSNAELRDMAIALSAKLPGVVDFGVAGPGIMVFELKRPVAYDVFNAFVADVSQAAYDYIY